MLDVTRQMVMAALRADSSVTPQEMERITLAMDGDEGPGYTIRQIAEKYGVSRSAAWRWVKGLRKPRMRVGAGRLAAMMAGGSAGA